MNYGKAIRIARSIADLSQGELADKSGLDRSYLSLIESEKRKPSIETLQNISNALDIPFHLLTLLATEREDTKRINDEQVLGLAKQLTYLLLETPHDNESSSDKASDRKHSRPGASPRGKKSRVA
jgi:XRE family transcriptional regulator, master regulator for biofilm formation